MLHVTLVYLSMLITSILMEILLYELSTRKKPFKAAYVIWNLIVATIIILALLRVAILIFLQLDPTSGIVFIVWSLISHMTVSWFHNYLTPLIQDYFKKDDQTKVKIFHV